MPDNIPFPLYHGTSTLFMDSIFSEGLGGIDPIKKNRIIDLAREVKSLADANLADCPDYQSRRFSFDQMTKQSTGQFNWQHGESYLSPSIHTAIRYATNKRFGSEIVTYTLDILTELIRRKIPGVTDNLFQKYPQAFGWLDSSPSPLLIRVNDVSRAYLESETNTSCSQQIAKLESLLKHEPKSFGLVGQQMNFRLSGPISANQIELFLIQVTEWQSHGPTFNLYPINPTKTELG